MKARATMTSNTIIMIATNIYTQEKAWEYTMHALRGIMIDRGLSGKASQLLILTVPTASAAWEKVSSCASAITRVCWNGGVGEMRSPLRYAETLYPGTFAQDTAYAQFTTNAGIHYRSRQLTAR